MASVVGLGIDVVDIDRIERAILRRPRFVERVFTPGERAYCERRFKAALHFAARFAAKEAAIKALGLRRLCFHDMEVVGEGPPALRLSGLPAALLRDRGLELLLSVTHSAKTAAAVVVATDRPGRCAGAVGDDR